MKYFLNKGTGELFKTDVEEEFKAVVEYPSVNVLGWCVVSKELYDTLTLVSNFGYERGKDNGYSDGYDAGYDEAMASEYG